MLAKGVNGTRMAFNPRMKVNRFPLINPETVSRLRLRIKERGPLGTSRVNNRC
ncbi:Uncharacterised protein [Kluyvera cryocrescens]|uniref:Uncharacterized protein n=1 Tax=Kluyvera cryocrescens TaxID=580 RepID=A0A485APW4_KLUCR|nr:Uncharacterised protein [Kluyvera cryocrescens]